MFGDHLPTMGLQNSDMKSGDIYKTKYITWNNMGPVSYTHLDVYKRQGSYNALALQIPVLIVMLVIAVFVCINKSAWECKQCF